MTLEQMEALFEEYDSEFIEFARIEHPRHHRPDLCAFLMLHELAPTKAEDYPYGLPKMVCHAEHDNIWLDADVDTVAANATPEQIRDLIRCGVRYDSGNCCFLMFV